MARRGGELREHILRTAKDVFLEMGFERASMDVMAARAATSKRSLYAHFESKDKLFLAVVDLVRELYLGKLKTPDAYGEDTAKAVVVFCGRFLQLLLWEPALRTCRLGITEAGRLPEASAQYYDAIFDTTHERLAAFLSERCQLAPSTSTEITHDLLGRTVYPRLFRALLGVEKPLNGQPDEASIAADIDLAPIRTAVAALLPSEGAGTPRP
ncbi:MAG: TetR/AcrR family transcriptional regulator [Streptosporangiaceae bacterium]